MDHGEKVSRNRVILFLDDLDYPLKYDNPSGSNHTCLESKNSKEIESKQSAPKSIHLSSYNPSYPIKPYIYRYSDRFPSSLSLEKTPPKNTELMVLFRQSAPDFEITSDFRKEDKGAIKGV